jgi:endo-1,4-beta-xylanase
MTNLTRRKFMKSTAFAGIGAAIGSATVLSAPSILTRPRTQVPTGAGELLFRPQYCQRGRGPHLLEWAYASDTRGDAFHSNISSTREGVRISDTEGREKFTVEARWNLEPFGYLFLTADNAGEFYTLPPAGKTMELNLNYELARSRVARNLRRMKSHTQKGWKPSREVVALMDIAGGYLAESSKVRGNEEKKGLLAQSALLHAVRVSEMLELEKAWSDIELIGHRPDFLVGCDSRGFYEMDKDLFLDRFTELFNYATMMCVWQGQGNMEDFEPQEGRFQFGQRDYLLKELRSRNIAVEGRPLFWFHKWVTPDWIKSKSYDQLLSYVERTTKEVVRHFGDQIYGWEIVNELHDWANECQLTREQTIELTRLGCDVARSVAPGVHRIVNNCCPYAEYVQLGESSGGKTKYPQRTPWQFTKDLVDAGVDFTVLAQQMYFPYRDLQDIVVFLERFQEFKKPFQLSEVGAPAGPSEYSIKTGRSSFPKEPHIWRRPWDEELQADWLEGIFTLAYSKPWIEAANWFDFADPYFYIENGGILRSPKGEKKAGFERLSRLLDRWKNLPAPTSRKGG